MEEPQQKRLKAKEDGTASFEVMTEVELKPLLLPYSEEASFAPSLRSVLHEHGMAVVTGVLDPKELAELEETWKRECGEESALPKLEISEPDWWANAWLHAQGEFAWKARVHPRVRNTFAGVFDTSASGLSCSTDMIVPFAVADAPAQSDNRQWLHVDLNTHTGITHECYQSVLYLWPSEGRSRSTTAVWPGSHKEEGIYGRLMRDPLAKEKGQLRNAYGIPYGHYVELSSLQSEGSKALLEEAVQGTRRIPVPAGALLLWSSRTIHQGWSGGPRLAVPVCWEPKERISEEARRRKVVMAAAGYPSTHSPSEGLVHPCVATRRGTAVRMRRPQVRPFSVLGVDALPEAEWDKLWAPWEGEQYAEDLVRSLDAAPLERALKPEILAVL